MIVVLRDLTIANGSADVDADISGNPLKLQLNPEHEYMIIDHSDVLDPKEFTSLDDIKIILNAAEEAGLSENDLRILSRVYLFSEILDAAKSDFENVEIINFDQETSTWNNGNGVSATDENLGRVLYEYSGYNSFGCEIPEELMDYIHFEQNWISAEAEGYRSVSVLFTDYIVRCAA